jgi:hypothetical protein
MATTTNYAWETPDDTDLVKDGAAAIRTLGSSIDTTTKALNPSTTLGDIEYRSATANTNTRLGIGTSGQVLSVSGGVPAWATPSSGGMTSIASGSLSTAQLSLTSIPSTYQNLQLVLNNVGSTSSGTPTFTLNNDTGGNYGNTWIGISNVGSNNSTTNYPISFVTLPSANNGYSIIFNLFNYANTSTRKLINAFAFKTSGSGDHRTYFGGYDATGAINSIQFNTGAGTFSSGTYTLWGIK